jgi:quinol monooxygenase YgiN
MATTVLLDVQLKPDSLDEAYAAVHETLEQTRAFTGAISLEVLIDNTDPTRLVVVETWESDAAHDAYVAWRATPEGAAALGPFAAAAPVTRVFGPSEL